MEVKIIVMLILILCINSILSEYQDKKTQMVYEMIDSFDKIPVVALVCWENSYKINLAKKLKSINSARTFQYLKSFNGFKRYTGENLLVIFDLNCPHKHRLLQEADVNEMFEPPFKWLMLNVENITKEYFVPVEFRNIDILVNSEVVLASKMANDDILLTMIYKIDNISDINIEMYGIWSENSLHINDDIKTTTTTVRRKNLRGKAIGMSVVVTNENTKTDILQPLSFSNIMTDVYAKGSLYDLIPLYDYMNVTIRLVFTDTWGYKINNTWSGVVGQLDRGEADLCGMMLYMSLDRYEVLDYMIMPQKMKVYFVFMAPPLSLQNNLFVLPFSNTLWACIGALLVVLVVIIYVNAVWERTKEISKKNDPTNLQPSVSDAVLCITGALTQQGCYAELKGSLGRTVTFITLLSFLFIYTSYSASIVALLQSTSDQIRTLTDLLNSKLQLGVEDQPYSRHFFIRATDPVKKAIYEQKVLKTGYKPNFMHIEEGIKKIRDPNNPFAFHMDVGYGYRMVNQYFHEHEKCSLREILYLPPDRQWYCCRKKSPYREIYKIGLSRILEHGLSQRTWQQLLVSKPRCETSGGSVASVNMVDFKPVLMCWVYGVILSLVVLAVEILVHRRKRSLEL